MNFKKETYTAIKNSGYKRLDVCFIGSIDGRYRVNMDVFDELSDFAYDNGFGAPEIATDLIIYFNDMSYITRGEYDGKEWWEYKPPLVFEKTQEYRTIKNFGGKGVLWETVERLNNEIKEPSSA